MAAVGVGPHIHERRPAEKLHQTDSPKHARCILYQFQQIVFAFLRRFWCSVIFGIFGGRHLAHRENRVKHARYQYGCADVERVDNRIGHYALGCHIADANPSEEKREQKPDHIAQIAQKTLNGVYQTLLFFVHKVANHHFERLHRYVDTRVEQHGRHHAKSIAAPTVSPKLPALGSNSIIATAVSAPTSR